MCLPVHYADKCRERVKGLARETLKEKEEYVEVLVFVGYLCIFEWVLIFQNFVVMVSVGIIFDKYLCSMGAYTP